MDKNLENHNATLLTMCTKFLFLRFHLKNNENINDKNYFELFV